MKDGNVDTCSSGIFHDDQDPPLPLLSMTCFHRCTEQALQKHFSNI